MHGHVNVKYSVGLKKLKKKSVPNPWKTKLSSVKYTVLLKGNLQFVSTSFPNL
jgi:hypothetical protein